MPTMPQRQRHKQSQLNGPVHSDWLQFTAMIYSMAESTTCVIPW